MNIENIQETIKKYLDNTMTPSEKADFELQIRDSTELAEQVRQFRQLKIWDKNSFLIQSNAVLTGVMADIDIEPNYGIHEKYFKKSLFDRPVWRWLMGGLVLATLLSGGFLYQQNQASKALNQLAKSHLEPLPNFIGFAENDSSQPAKAMASYDNKNYSEAIERLKSATKNSPDDNSLKLYLAVSYLMQDQNAQAQTLLEDSVKTDNLSTIPAKWYLALTYMQIGKKDEAYKLLQSLESDLDYGKDVKDILKKW